MVESYYTVRGGGEAEIVEKKSRFIAHVIPVTQEKEALEHIEKIKKKYWDARHNCYAFVLGLDGRTQRYSDDGEPGGTAGMPMLEVLLGEGVKNVLVVVTRYFGGTLLGTGGLVRAYSKSTKEGLLAAGIVERVLYRQINVTVGYDQSGKVQYEAAQGGHITEDAVYAENVCFKLLVRVSAADKFIKDITNVTNGKAEIEVSDDVYR
ncbi:MAG: YigZ family protein [Firmicutes bacterium]|nr:YigZ family protein [Bacillota bacterium]